MMSNVLTLSSLKSTATQAKSFPFATKLFLTICVTLYLITAAASMSLNPSESSWAFVPSIGTVCLIPSSLATATISQMYRVHTFGLFHLSAMHIMFNMGALWATGQVVERKIGTMAMLQGWYYLAVLGALFHVLIAYAMMMTFGPEWSDEYNSCSVGSSGAIFGLIVLEIALTDSLDKPKNLFGPINVPGKLYPVALLVALQLLIPNVSFPGHLSGILAGQVLLLTRKWTLQPKYLRRFDNFSWLANLPGYQKAHDYAPVGGVV